MPNIRSFLLFLVPALGIFLQSTDFCAQPYRADCPDCWRNYTFDPDDFDFLIGAHGWYLPQFYKDTLRLDFGQQYSAENTLHRDTLKDHQLVKEGEFSRGCPTEFRA